MWVVFLDVIMCKTSLTVELHVSFLVILVAQEDWSQKPV